MFAAVDSEANTADRETTDNQETQDVSEECNAPLCRTEVSHPENYPLVKRLQYNI